MNLFWTIWKKSLVRSQPNHQASKKASKNAFLFLSLIKRAELSLSLWEGTSAIDVWSEPLFFWFHTNDRPADTDGHGEYTMKHVQEISVENKRAVCLTWVLYRARSFLNQMSWWSILLHSGKPMNCFVYTPRKHTKWTPHTGKCRWEDLLVRTYLMFASENIWKNWVFSVCSSHISLSPDCQISKMFDCSLQPFKLITA